MDYAAVSHGFETVRCVCVAVVIIKLTTFIPFLRADPAQALKMPQQTYLPTGMDGVITCPVAAQPPLLYVDWTKDGEPLDLSLVIKIITLR